jgi:hypothetical protein
MNFQYFLGGALIYLLDKTKNKKMRKKNNSLQIPFSVKEKTALVFFTTSSEIRPLSLLKTSWGEFYLYIF